ncbi:MAG: pimeloyl-ACP methyl ester carboxylesterase [Marivirga sp.]
MKVYGIGGLGVDERVFSALNLDFELIALNWIDPQSKESTNSYANRLAEQIDQKASFAIIGVSFGGMIAIELSKILNPEKIILISSATSEQDILLAFRLFGKTGIIHLVPDFLIKPPQFLVNYFFGISDDSHKKALKQILADTDLQFLRWAANKIMKWDNSELPSNLVRIHGSADRLLNYQKKDKVTVIPTAGHFMIMNRADELSKILNKEVKNER